MSKKTTEKRCVYTSIYPPPDVHPLSSGESMTKQCFKEECDINNIVKRYMDTGILGDPFDTRKPVFGDFSDVPDFHEAQGVIAKAFEQFADLPAEVRDRFANNPAQLMEFLDNPANRDEAIKLGLVSSEPASDVGTNSEEIVS